MFLLVSGGHIGVREKGHQHGVSIQSFINLGKPFFRISRIWNITQTWFLARLFVYLPSFISQILDLLYWMVCSFIFHSVKCKPKIDWVFLSYSMIFRLCWTWQDYACLWIVLSVPRRCVIVWFPHGVDRHVIAWLNCGLAKIFCASH